VDVVIVGRGGGSIEDLWAFNLEPVARAIAACPLPVISAVGHESDVTIADLVADVRAPTPSAAAELVVTRKDEFIGRIDRLHDRLVATARARVQRLSRRVHELSGRRAIAGFTARLAMTERRADELTRATIDAMRSLFSVRDRQIRALDRRLDASNASRRLARDRTRLVTADGALHRLIAVHSHRARMKLGQSAGRLDTLSPLGVLSRGYAVCWNEDQTRAIRDAADVAPGDTVHVTLSRGAIAAKVSRTE
jgi:exodeoxyribonuclease VII large subunit